MESKELEQLRADIESVKQAIAIFKKREMWHAKTDADYVLGDMENALARLETAEAEKTDPFHEAKMSLDACGLEDVRGYVRHLEAENKRLEAELARKPNAGPWVVIPADQDRIKILGRMHQYREYVFPRYADAINHRAKAYTPSDYKIVLLSDVFCTGEQR